MFWDKVFKNGPGKIYGRQPFKNFKGYGLIKHLLKCYVAHNNRSEIETDTCISTKKTWSKEQVSGGVCMFLWFFSASRDKQKKHKKKRRKY